MKTWLLYLFILISSLLSAQVTTSPATPTASSAVTITFDAAGTELENYSGDVYAHTGVTVNGIRWQNVIAEWNENTEKAKLTRSTTNNNIYTFEISPDLYTFYGVTTDKTISEICIVIRSSDGSKQTRPDTFITIYDDGLNIVITSPTNNAVYNLNETITISAEASLNSNLNLLVNNTSVETASNTTTISTSYNLSNSGLYTLKATAETGSENAETQLSIYVKTQTQNKPLPTDVTNGININTDGTVTFVLLAPNKTDVFLIGDFNNWELNQNYQMYKDGEYFWITLNNLDPNTEYAYQYFIDYEVKVADPYSDKILDPWTDQYIKQGNYPNLKEYPTNKTTGYVSTFLINEENYNWQIANFDKPNSDNLIIYELHIRDFTESDSFKEAITHLDYLATLGVNAIELMPINEFEGADSWGYNPALYMALDKAYGTKNDFKKFVDECHKRGMAVIADVVFNHSYGQSPLLQMYWDSVTSQPTADNPWYNQKHNFVDNTSAHWGYDFNHESTYTTAFFKDVLSYWVNEYKIDGFRFDFTKGFSNTQWVGADNWASDYDASRIAILKNYADYVWSLDPTDKPYVIFEHLADNSEEKELANYGIMLWGNMNHNYAQNTMGYSSGSDIAWISYQRREWEQPNLVGYMESHDEERLMYKNLNFGNSNADYNVKNLNIALSREELAGMFFFTIPGPKMIWQFGELGYDYSIDENGRVGRKPIRWDYFENPNRKHIYTTWSTLIEFKKQIPVFNTSNFTLDVNDLTKSIILRDAEMDVVLLGNFEVTEQTISAPFTQNGTWYEYFTGNEISVSGAENFTLKPGEYRLYSTKKLLDPRGGTANDDSDNDGVVDTEDLCPNTMEGTTVNASGCPVFSLAANNFTIETTSETCPDKNNGSISISANENLSYTATLNSDTKSFTSTTTFESLAPGSYNLCIVVDNEDYEQCYTLTIEEGTTVSGKTTITKNTANVQITQGTAPFSVFVNGVKVNETNNPNISIEVSNGDLLEVKTAVECEGILSENIENLIDITGFPNPTESNFNLYIPYYKNEKITVEIYNTQSQLVSKQLVQVQGTNATVETQQLPTGMYFVKVFFDTPRVIKFIKE